MEGPACFKLFGENKWCLLLDAYTTEGKYVPYYTTDLNSAQFIKDTIDFDMPVRSKRGGVIPISIAEYNVLIEAYGN